MSNFHEFGKGTVCVMHATHAGDGSRLVSLHDVDAPMQMDVVHPGGEGIPLHATCLHFPTKEAMARFIRILAESMEENKWKE